ncbi:MAG: hypothetical protein H6828_14340 [Planctomycetes bacterium]|nr:hypothetical protein [Planctomycetota bacterium]
MRFRPSLALLSLFAAAPLAGAQSYVTIAYESFDYPTGTDLHGQTGGTGWANAWWSDLAAGVPDTEVVAPSLDGVGNCGQTTEPDTGAYRFPATAGFEHLLMTPGKFGADGSTIWISFWCQQAPGSTAGYGGLSLNEQFVAEHLFLGSPFGFYEWGYHDSPLVQTGLVGTVPGSNVTQLSHLVYRLDFQTGDERLRLWIDPPVAHPDTTPDLDTPILDFTFNEIGIKSGSNPGSLWWFDGIELSAPVGGAGTAFCAGELTCPCGNAGANGSGCANGTGLGAKLDGIGSSSITTDNLVLFVDGLVPNQPGLLFQGDNQVNGGAGNPFGDGLRCAGGGVKRIQITVADGSGHTQSSVSIAGATGVVGGDTKRYQYWYRDPVLSPCGTAFNLSNGLEIAWQP